MQPPDAAVLEQFWHFIAERHNAYWRRTLGAPPPWATDPVVARNHFTNIYRELDPGTRFIIAWARRHPEQNLAPTLLNVGAYRLAFHEESMEALGWLNPRKVWAPRLQQALEAIPHPFTGAYLVSNYGRAEPKTKVIAEIVEGMAKNAHALAARLLMVDTREEAWRAIVESWHGVGKFVAFQSLVDLSYSGVAPKLDPRVRDNDGFAAAGPGAHKGLQHLWPELPWAQCNEALKWLCQHQAPARRLMLGGWDGEAETRYIHRADMQNCCCEFDKWVRASLPGGRTRRTFDARARWQAAREAAGMGGQEELF